MSTSATVAMAGDYTLTVSNGCGSDDETTTVVVNSAPTAAAANSGPVCAGGTISLTGGPDGMASYSWTGPNGFTSQEQSPTVSTSATVAMAGDYTLTVSNGCGSDDETTTVVVNGAPTATVDNVSTCQGTTASLTADTFE